MFLDFIRGCLEFDPRRRIRAKEALNHPLFVAVRGVKEVPKPSMRGGAGGASASAAADGVHAAAPPRAPERRERGDGRDDRVDERQRHTVEHDHTATPSKGDARGRRNGGMKRQ